MPEQVLTIFERHTCRAQPPPKGVFEIVNPNVSKPRRRRFCVLFRPSICRAFPRRLSGRVVHLGHWSRLADFLVRAHEYIDWM